MDITKQVNVVPDNPTVIDLSKIQVKTGVLNITSNVDGYKLYLNDKEQNAGESPLLEYGTYTVKATKDGYKDFTSSVTIDSDTNTLNIKMKKSETGGTLNLILFQVVLKFTLTVAMPVQVVFQGLLP